jgi:hypothetical protein
VPTRTQVRGKGAIAVAAQATTENKLKVRIPGEVARESAMMSPSIPI